MHISVLVDLRKYQLIQHRNQFSSHFLPTQFSTVDEAPSFLKIFSYSVSMVLQVFLPCFYGNEILVASSKISTSLFHHSKWLNGNKHYKAAVKIFLENAKKSIKIQAFSLVSIDFTTFTRICNSAYSLYALFSKG